MGAAVVPLVRASPFVFDDVAAGTTVSTTVVKRMPFYAWLSGTLTVRVLANSLVAGSHRFTVQVFMTAPTCEDAATQFVGALWSEKAIATTDVAGRSVVFDVWKNAPPFADLVIKMENVDSAGGSPAGAITISIDAVVRGRSFDRVEYGDVGHREATP